MITVGGIKVSPESVEEVILGAPEVSMPMAVGRSSSIIGQVVEALVVAQPGSNDADQLIEAVQEACRDQLRREAVSASFILCPSPGQANSITSLEMSH